MNEGKAVKNGQPVEKSDKSEEGEKGIEEER